MEELQVNFNLINILKILTRIYSTILKKMMLWIHVIFCLFLVTCFKLRSFAVLYDSTTISYRVHLVYRLGYFSNQTSSIHIPFPCILLVLWLWIMDTSSLCLNFLNCQIRNDCFLRKVGQLNELMYRNMYAVYYTEKCLTQMAQMTQIFAIISK